MAPERPSVSRTSGGGKKVSGRAGELLWKPLLPLYASRVWHPCTMTRKDSIVPCIGIHLMPPLLGQPATEGARYAAQRVVGSWGQRRGTGGSRAAREREYRRPTVTGSPLFGWPGDTCLRDEANSDMEKPRLNA